MANLDLWLQRTAPARRDDLVNPQRDHLFQDQYSLRRTQHGAGQYQRHPSTGTDKQLCQVDPLRTLTKQGSLVLHQLHILRGESEDGP